MNGVIARLCQRSRADLVSNVTVSTLTELNMVAEKFTQVGPIPSALLLTKIVQPASCMHPVHQKLVNRLTRTIDASASEIPVALSLQVFNALSQNQHPFSRRLLATVQSKWFDSWQPPSVERGSRRPKLKQNFVGPFADGASVMYKIAHTCVIRNLDDETLRESVSNIAKLYQSQTGNNRDIALLSRELVWEYQRRFHRDGECFPQEIQHFIQILELE